MVQSVIQIWKTIRNRNYILDCTICNEIFLRQSEMENTFQIIVYSGV